MTDEIGATIQPRHADACGLNDPVKYTDPTGHNYCDHINNNNADDCNGGESRINKRDNLERLRKQHETQNSKSESGCYAGHPCMSSWQPPSYWDLNPADPDYITFTINGTVLTGTITIDRYRQIYLGGGGNIGKSILLPTYSLTAGWIGSPADQEMPSQGNIGQFLGGITFNAGAGFIGGGSVTVSPSTVKYVPDLYGFNQKYYDVPPIAVEGGAYIPPGAGVSGTISIPLTPLFQRLESWLKYGK